MVESVEPKFEEPVVKTEPRAINDFDMLRFVGHGLAMGNGSDIIKETAEFVTTHIKEDGIFNALKHYGLI